jgi:hypothetical protein
MFRYVGGFKIVDRATLGAVTSWRQRAVESHWVHSALLPPIGLLRPHRMIMMMEKLVE